MVFMKGWKLGALAAVVMLGVAVSPLWAQRTPYIGYIYPAGGRQGAKFQAVLSGQYLDGLTNVVVTGSGVEGVVVEHIKPLNGRQITLLRDRLRNMQQGLKETPKTNAIVSFVSEYNTNVIERLDRAALEKEMEEIRRKLANPKNQRPPNPQLAEDAALRISIAPDAPPGRRELRVRTAAGLSNPVTFYVGELPEHLEVEPKANPTELGATVSLPVVINGQILPGDVDRYRFRGRRGERLVLHVQARDLIPYVADAVPGWFQATVALYDSKGKELQYADDFRFNPDPVLYYELPNDGEYVIEIKDAIYRGREDFVYRITAGALPFITSIYPLGGPVGQTTKVELKGWNLPQTTLEVRPEAAGLQWLQVSREKVQSPPVPFYADNMSETQDVEANNSVRNAQKVTLPIIINGRINQPGDLDVFAFDGKAGEQVVAEIMARRLNSPLDSLLRVTDAQGKQLAINDDHEDKASGLNTHHADSFLLFTLPADGRYYVQLSDTQQQGGPDHAYRLRLSAPQPDFELRIVPASLNSRAGSSVAVTVHALRKDGFTNEIKLALKDAPKGFALSASRVPPGTNMARINLTVPAAENTNIVVLVIEGRANINGREVTRVAVPAQDMMQAFYYRHLVPAQELQVAVIGRPPPARPAAAAKASASPAKTPAKK